MTQVTPTTFTELLAECQANREGLVFYATGGDPMEWVDGISKLLCDEGIGLGNAEGIFKSAHLLTTTGGRTDLCLIWNAGALEIDKLAWWRLRFGDCCWLSDYVVNYADQHGMEVAS